MLKYCLIGEKIKNEYIGEYISYGIELRHGDEVIESIKDIDTDGEAVGNLCRLCNELKLSPIHFRDVVEDYLAR